MRGLYGLVFIVATSSAVGCASLLGLDPGEPIEDAGVAQDAAEQPTDALTVDVVDAGGTVGDTGCAPGRKVCANDCVAVSDPIYGCTGVGCAPECKPSNAQPTCAAEGCAIGACFAPYGNCDNDAANGCEKNLNSDKTSCGGCGKTCPNYCVDGGCADDCGAPNGVCGSDCRALDTDPANCGACDHACDAGTNATPRCVARACTFACIDTTKLNCDNDAASGCAINPKSDFAHCGGCGTDCSKSVAPAGMIFTSCADGGCKPACAAGFKDCDNDVSNGCECPPSSACNAFGTCVGAVADAGAPDADAGKKPDATIQPPDGGTTDATGPADAAVSSG